VKQLSPLIIDVAGKSLTPKDRNRIVHPITGGVILFARNWSDRAQLAALCRDIKQTSDENALILVDQEGGRVQRFASDGFTPLPSMRMLGELWMRDGGSAGTASARAAQEAADATGFVMASELRACGVDMSFAPVLDLDHGPSTVIGDRAFHRDPKVVTALATSLMAGMRRAGMAACGKHFPGHGHVAADSHTDVPVDDRALETILADDAAPYGWLKDSLPSVMPAHVIYPQVDGLPAGFSRRWLQEILRGRLGFRGAIFSDDLSMAGARTIDGRELSYTEAAIRALQAGCDMVLLCNQCVEDGGHAIDALIDGVHNYYFSGDPRRIDDTDANETRRLALMAQGNALEWDQLMVDPTYRRARGLLPDAA